MKRFLERHSGRITGTLSGFDRVLFRGTLPSIAHVSGLEVFLYSQHVLFWLPFTIQVCLNGREWLARKMDRAGISYTKRDNCFTYVSDLKRAQQLMDRLTERNWGCFLDALAQRVNPWINPRTGLDVRSYYWSVRQGEYTALSRTEPRGQGALFGGAFRGRTGNTFPPLVGPR
jgi:hypothetical protein